MKRPNVLLGLASASTLALALLAGSPAHADAVLTHGNTQLFPTHIDISVEVRAQIEATTVVFDMPPIETAGDYTLAMPTPDGANPIGVDIDRGQGYVALPVIEGIPPNASGSGTTTADYDKWIGTTPLGATLQQLEPGALAVRVKFVRVLRRVGGKVGFEVGSHRCPLRPSLDPGAATSVHLALATARDLTQFSATSATLDTSNATMDASSRGASFTTSTAQGDAVVAVNYAEQSSGINVQLVTHRTPTSDPQGGDAGYFLLLLDADNIPSTTPRAISMVIDHSGSMAGDKIAQARDAARSMLDYLKPEDSFTIHKFDDDVDSFRPTPVPATPDNIQAARAFIKEIEADASTDLNAGLQAALKAPSSANQFDATILLSDGMATAGETNDTKIVANAWHTAATTRIYTFSVGSDADFPLMQALATGSRGKHVDLNNAQATRDLVLRAKDLFQDIRDVRLTDLELTVSNVTLFDTVPEKMPDLFSGGQVILVGRYASPGAAEITITGKEGAAPFTKTFVVDAPELAESNEIIKYVWASEKVRSLMGSIANGASESDVREDVVGLGIAYRIQTPFTHYNGSYDTGAGSTGESGCSVGGDAGPLAFAWVGFALGFARRRRRVRETR